VKGQVAERLDHRAKGAGGKPGGVGAGEEGRERRGGLGGGCWREGGDVREEDDDQAASASAALPAARSADTAAGT
jgi:hypothetical protein